jgi:hypothetical protein
MKTKRGRESYIYLHPGYGPPITPEEWAKIGKPGQHKLGDDGKAIEYSVFTCPHCHFCCDDPRAERNWCYSCDSWVCSEPACVAASKGRCWPLRAMMDEARVKELPILQARAQM